MPYAKRPKTSDDLDKMDDMDKKFHYTNKPRWSVDGTLVYAASGNAPQIEGSILAKSKQPIVSEYKDIRFAKIATHPDVSSSDLTSTLVSTNAAQATPETLIPQKDVTQIILEHGIPKAAVNGNFKFSQLAQLVAIDTEEGRHEQQVWQVASILFDDVELPVGLVGGARALHVDRIRKAKLSEFWESLVFDDAQMQVQEAESTEAKALAHLTAHNVIDACQTLIGGKDFRLATMVAQIGCGVPLRQDIQSQLVAWNEAEVLSEMEESVRAIYELLAGNCTKSRSEGNLKNGLEDRVSEFNISSRFGLDWRRSFGIRLWYGILGEEPLNLAVAQYSDDLREGREDVKPVPWFVENGLNMGWNDPHPEVREDLLWGLLKLYGISHDTAMPANVENIFSPQSATGNPLNARLSFQLCQLFQARVIAAPPNLRISSLPISRSETGFGASLMSSTSSVSGGEQAPDPFVELSDSIALTYASTLLTPENWVTAVYVYTHLSNPANREHHIRSAISFFSPTFSTSESDPTYATLTKDLRVPKSWLHAAKALQAKSEGDATTECRELLLAGDLGTAHDVLCHSVAPAAIIARDHDALRELLGDFESPPNSPLGAQTSTMDLRSSTRGASAKAEPVEGWRNGGQIYFDYIHLLDLDKGAGGRHADAVRAEIVGVVARLSASLEAVAGADFAVRNLEERVALGEIAGAVAGWGMAGGKARVLKLPLTEDRWLRHSRELSAGYYRAVLAAAR
jgi:nuclear pore complex protein Nup98-Nup96